MHTKTIDFHWQAEALLTLRFGFVSGCPIAYGSSKGSMTGTTDSQLNDSVWLAGIRFFYNTNPLSLAGTSDRKLFDSVLLAGLQSYTTTINFHCLAPQIVYFTFQLCWRAYGFDTTTINFYWQAQEILNFTIQLCWLAYDFKRQQSIFTGRQKIVNFTIRFCRQAYNFKRQRSIPIGRHNGSSTLRFGFAGGHTILNDHIQFWLAGTRDRQLYDSVLLAGIRF